MSDAPLDPRHAVYVGSFDPLTLGHTHIIRRGAAIYERVTVGIGINPDKTPLFSAEERLELTRQALGHLENVSVRCFQGLAVNFVLELGAGIMLRGIRTLSDMEGEFRMTLANRALAPEIETVFLMASERYTHISSTLIKQIARMGQPENNAHLEQFLPQEIVHPLLAKFAKLPPVDSMPQLTE